MCPLRAPAAVIIVNCRVYDDLDRALSAVGEALGPADEVVVFDQLTDPAAMSAVSARHPRVTWMTSDRNLGFAAAVNRAAARTSAPFLLLLNPDTVVSPLLVDTLVSWLESDPAAGLVGPRVVNPDGSVQGSARRFPGLSAAVAGRSTWLSTRFPNNWLTRRNLLARSSGEAVAVDWLAGSCLLIRREVFERLGGLDEGFFLYWEDADFAWRARALGFGCVYLPTVSVSHAGGRSANLDPAPATRAFHRSAYRLYVKRSGAFGRLVAPLVRLMLWARGEWRVMRLSR
jgi:N-acetylglucosaminyl-diphospho-decaprenol L-rhamnosyltransferase